MVNDNDILKSDNAELQHLLAESREDLRSLQETLEEQRANIAISPHCKLTIFSLLSNQFNNAAAETSHSRNHYRLPSISLKDPKPRRNRLSQQFDSRLNPGVQETSMPDTPVSTLLIPTEPLTPGGQSSPQYPPSHVSYEVDEYPDSDADPFETGRRRAHRPLLLLTRSRGTQTEPWPSPAPPSPLPSQLSSISPYDAQSETSSFSDSLTSHVSTILERILTLLNRMSQADALTLTTRLKRQRLKGADVGHLSRSTVNHIVAEATGLRTQFRSLLEDDKTVLNCTRKDMRLLFKFIKDVFAEMGQMRVTLNNVILDPSTANRVSELALNPGKADIEAQGREVSAYAAAGWMAPISKLFSPAGRTDATSIDRHSTLVSSTSTRGTTRPTRHIPKLGPALAASATTVNVEFSGTGRSVTSTFSSQCLTQADSHPDTAPGVMDIFAGAPRINAGSDPWIVIPPTQQVLRKSRSFRKMEEAGGRSSRRTNANRLSRNVDAVIDIDSSRGVDEELDRVPPLLERTLRRRGLSDSSIHSTLTSHADATPSPHVPTTSSRLPAWPDRSSVFQALSRTVQNIRATAAGTITPLKGIDVGAETQISPRRQKSGIFSVAPFATKDNGTDPPSRSQTPNLKIAQPKPIRIASPNKGDGENVLRHPSSWANLSLSHDAVSGSDPLIVSSLRDESRMSHSRVRDERGRPWDFF